MIHVFHGFLGSPADFSFLPSRPDIICHKISDPFPEIGPEDVLIGYSMGGRLALELAAQVDFRIQKIILLNSHPGLNHEEERKERARWEDEILARMDQDIFLSYWNSLSIFKHDRALTELTQHQLNEAKKTFEVMRLSKQKNFLPMLQLHKDKILWIIGSLDEKYRSIADKTLLPLGIKCRFIEAGHRLFQHPDLIMEVLKDEGIL